MPISEEWTAWFLVRERERELQRQQRIREAEDARLTQPRPEMPAAWERPRARRRRPARTPRDRKAA